jgi:hypothetical protein
MEKTHGTVMQDRHVTTRLLAECLGEGKEVAREIWTETCRKGRFV